MRFFFLLLALSLASWAYAQETVLTLDEALAQVTIPHPDLTVFQARADIAEAERELAESLGDFRLSLEGTVRTGRNALTDDKYEPDHQLRLNGRKLLWDGGRQDANVAAARLESAGRGFQLLGAKAQRRLAIMARFFDVLLTDLQYAADNEYMAVAYVTWDNAKDRHQLGEISNAGLADLEARYQEVRLKRNGTLRKAREKRALLANALNRPGELPSELRDPDLKGNDRPLPEFAALLHAMLAQNPQLLAQQQLIAASGKRLDAANADSRPSLEFEAEAAAFSREAYTRDNLRAGVNLVWPLYQGDQSEARRAREAAQTRLLTSQYDSLLLSLRQDLYEVREEIMFLRETERKVAESVAIQRDWSLEKARAEYELEMKTNLGNSMADTQGARLRQRAIEYRLALAWERLEALLGTPVETVPLENKKS